MIPQERFLILHAWLVAGFSYMETSHGEAKDQTKNKEASKVGPEFA
jgi:hypothetical protein